MTSSLGDSEIHQFPRPRPLSSNATPPVSGHRVAKARWAKRVKRELPFIRKLASKRMGEAPRSTRPPRHHYPHQEIRPNDVIIHRCRTIQRLNNALDIFTRLPAILKLEGRTPQVYCQHLSRREIQLKYPDFESWKVIDCLHWTIKDGSAMKVQVPNLRQLEDCMLKYIPLLCDAHIYLYSDLSTLRFTLERGESGGLWPILDKFKLGIDPRRDDKNEVDWAERRRYMERRVKSQFQVFEILARPGTSLDLRGDSNAGVHPEDAVRILKTRHAPPRPQNEVLLFVDQYTSVFGQYVIKMGNTYLRLIASEDEEEPDLETLTLYSHTVKHALGLLEADDVYIQGCKQSLAERAVLWVISLIIQFHLRARGAEELGLSDLPKIEPPSSSDACSSSPDIDLIKEADRKARDAVSSTCRGGEWRYYPIWPSIFSSLELVVRALD